MRYTLDDILIGDEVAWKSDNPGQPDFDECWELHGKHEGRLLIRLYHLGKEHFWTLDLKEVLFIVPASRERLKS